MKQAEKKRTLKKGAGVSGFNFGDYKKGILGETKSKSADKGLEWIIMPKAFQDALKLPGIPMGRTSMVRGWSDTGKSTLKNVAIGNAMKQGILPIIFETEGNFDFQYAKDCGMQIEPVYGEVEKTDPETGEIYTVNEIVDWDGDYILFTNNKICEFCGDMDYSQGKRVSKKRRVALIEDLGYIINYFLDEQDNGNLPMPILFVWDSIGTIQSWRSYSSKCGNNQFDAGAISTVFKSIFPRIASSKEIGSEYTNTLFVVNKIYKDSANSVGGAVAIANSGGEAFQYGVRLGIHVGGVAKAGTKKLKATLKGDEYQYGSVTKISVFKNQLPMPYNITYSGTMCCVHNGIIPEDEIDKYKKMEIPRIFEKIKNISGSSEITESDINDISFIEDGQVE